MEIGRLSSDYPVPVTDESRQTNKGTTSETAPRQDGVEISEEARRRLAELADLHLKKMESQGRLVDEPVTEPADNRLDAIRERIASGYYDRPEVIRDIADRMIDETDGE